MAQGLVKYPTGNASSDIYIATPNGHLMQVTDGISEIPPYDNFDADWSPDGSGSVQITADHSSNHAGGKYLP